jgi:hypothetical protein
MLLGSARTLLSPSELPCTTPIPLIGRFPAPGSPPILANEAAGVASRNARTIFPGGHKETP